MHNKATFRAAVLGLLGAAVMLAQDAPLPTGSINLNLPTTGPVAVAKMSNDSRLSARGAALVLDLHMALQLRNVSTKSINGLTLRVVSQEVALGGKNSVSYPALNVARVQQRHAQGRHDVPSDRVLSRRERSHALFEWFAREADIVLVFDNTAAPVYAAGKAGGMWDLADLDRLPDDVAATIRRLAG